MAHEMRQWACDVIEYPLVILLNMICFLLDLLQARMIGHYKTWNNKKNKKTERH